MEVRIGITQTPKEIEVDLAEGIDHDQLSAEVEATLANSEGVLWLTDRKGRRVGVPCSKVAYVEIGAVSENRRVGFGAN
ncbi:MAG: DUF3107 domain-containing protein [Acidimicrobiales bacterium]